MSNKILEFFKSNIGKEMSENVPPFSQWLRGTIAEAEEGSFTIDFVVRKEMTNPLGLLHGGVQAAMLDEVIGMTIAALDKPKPAVSINLHVDFIGKAVIGDKVRVISKVIRQGKQVIHAEGKLLLLENEKLIAKAVTNMLQIDLNKKKS